MNRGIFPIIVLLLIEGFSRPLFAPPLSPQCLASYSEWILGSRSDLEVRYGQFTDEQMVAIFRAHQIGSERGATHGNYRNTELNQKLRILRDAGINEEIRHQLVRDGVVGNAPFNPRSNSFRERLGLGNKYTQEELDDAYKAAASFYHPDANHQSPQAAADFKRITEAYESLDRSLKQRQSRTGEPVSLDEHLNRLFGVRPPAKRVEKRPTGPRKRLARVKPLEGEPLETIWEMFGLSVGKPKGWKGRMGQSLYRWAAKTLRKAGETRKSNIKAALLGVKKKVLGADSFEEAFVRLVEMIRPSVSPKGDQESDLDLKDMVMALFAEFKAGSPTAVQWRRLDQAARDWFPLAYSEGMIRSIRVKKDREKFADGVVRRMKTEGEDQHAPEAVASLAAESANRFTTEPHVFYSDVALSEEWELGKKKDRDQLKSFVLQANVSDAVKVEIFWTLRERESRKTKDFFAEALNELMTDEGVQQEVKLRKPDLWNALCPENGCSLADPYQKEIEGYLAEFPLTSVDSEVQSHYQALRLVDQWHDLLKANNGNPAVVYLEMLDSLKDDKSTATTKFIYSFMAAFQKGSPTPDQNQLVQQKFLRWQMGAPPEEVPKPTPKPSPVPQASPKDTPTPEPQAPPQKSVDRAPEPTPDRDWKSRATDVWNWIRARWPWGGR